MTTKPMVSVLFAGAALLGAGAMGAWASRTTAVGHASGEVGAIATQSADCACVATVNLERVLNELRIREKREADLQSLLGELNTELQEVISQFETARADLELLPEGTRGHQAKVIEIRELEGLIRFRRELFDREIALEKGRILRSLYNDIKNAADRVAAREGYGVVIIDDSSMTIPEGDVPEQTMLQLILNRRVISNTGNSDISRLIIQLMNTEFRENSP
jgi:Skp family chaperone for outer membrane proteins